MASKRTKKLYESPRWRKLRKKIIEKNIVCAACDKKGIVRAGREVDHIIPSSKLPLTRFYELSNLQLLCKPCHIKKTSEENSVDMLDCTIDGVPITDYDDRGYIIPKNK